MLIVQPSNKRKFRKLLRDPKLFFYDYFAKRIAVQNAIIECVDESVIKKDSEKKQTISIKGKEPSVERHLTVNYIANIQSQVESLVMHLMSLTCFVQIIPSPNANSFRIAVKGTDLLYIIACLKGYHLNNFSVKVEPGRIQANHKELIKCYIEDEKYQYRSPIIEIDPWYHSSGRIHTKNWNPYVTHIDEEYINKTVYSPHPYFLQKNPAPVHMVQLLDLTRSIHHEPDFPVDVVYTWVDSNDPSWKKRKELFSDALSSNPEDLSEARFHQIDEIRYSLRSVASYFKEVRNIYLVTDAQVPWWLDISHPKITIIDHKEIFQNQNDLPTFNSHAIEANLHRIPGLSENFVYMNDDVFLWSPLKKTVFFAANGLGISRFEKVSNIYGDPCRSFQGWKNAALQGNKILEQEFFARGSSYHEHCPHALKKSVMEEICKRFPEALAATSSHKFRGVDDLSPVSFFYHQYAYLMGKAVVGEGASLTVNSASPTHIDVLKDNLESGKYKFVCINDGGKSRLHNDVISLLREKFPVKAEWEVI